MTMRHTDAMSWDTHHSTRRAVHPITRYTPVSGTAATTAADIITIDKRDASVNLVQNPRIEATDIAEFVATGSAVARSTAQQALGAASLLVNPGNNGAGEGFYWTLGQSGYSNDTQWITAQCEHRGASTSNAVKLEIRDSTGATVLATSGSSNLATSWTRITASYAIAPTATPTTYRIYVTTQTDHNINFYVDKIMVEVRQDGPTIPTYFDGSSGIGYDWSGTAHASSSRRRIGMGAIKGIKIMNDTGSNAIYVAFDCVATATSGIKINGGETLETNHPLHFTKNISILSAAGTPAYHGVVWGTHF